MSTGKIIGARIRKRRKALKLTQKQLATLVGVRTSKVSHWETGYTAVKAHESPTIAKALQVPVERLVA